MSADITHAFSSIFQQLGYAVLAVAACTLVVTFLRARAQARRED